MSGNNIKAPRTQAGHSQRGGRRFISIRGKLLLILACFLIGLVSVISLDFYFDQVRQDMDRQVVELLAQSDRADRILNLVNVMQNNLYRVVYQDEVAFQSRILAENEDLLAEFEQFAAASQRAQLDEDYYFLRENETALLNLRAYIFRVVALVRTGEHNQAIQLMVQHVEPGVLHMRTFVENASELRRFRISDYYELRKELGSRQKLLEVVTLLVFLVVGLGIALYTARSIVKPIESLTRQIRDLKPGGAQASFILSSDSNDEAAILTDAFNQLLKTHQSALDLARQQEQFSSNLLNSTGEAIYGIDLEGKCTFANKTCLEILGNQSEQELLGKNMHQLIHHTRVDGTPYPVEECKIFRAIRLGEGSHVDDEVLWRADGGSFPAEYRSVPMRRDDEIIGAVVSFTDISDRKVLEQDRERVGAELTQLIDTANAPIFGINRQGRVNEWNQTAARLTGYEKDEIMGRDLVQDFITEEYQEPVKAVFDQALKGIETANFEFPLYTKEGRRLEILLNASTRRDLDGRVIGVIGIGQDITRMRQQEIALQQAQKMEAVGQLTGGIAHDFNNLLSIISGNLRFLQQDIGNTSDDINELFDDAMSAAADGAELTQRLLSFSRNRSLQPEDKNVNDAIEKFARFLSRTLGEGIELTIDLPDEDLYINVDPSGLENALLNLALNARDAMPQGGRISISTRRYDHGDGDGDGDGDEYRLNLAENNYIEVSIADTGSGINPQDLRHVYEPFFTTKEVGKGSGLGLSMVWGFTEQSGGACHIKSIPGEGTTVSMYFPEIIKSERTGKEKVSDESIASGSEVILVVEDEPRVRRVALRDLKKLGYQTLEAENADMAKAIIESGEPVDILFSDILMPGEMNGLKLGIWVEENHPGIKVVLTSGFSKGRADVSRDQARKFPLVRKPYSISKLAEQIRITLTGAEDRNKA